MSACRRVQALTSSRVTNLATSSCRRARQNMGRLYCFVSDRARPQRAIWWPIWAIVRAGLFGAVWFYAHGPSPSRRTTSSSSSRGGNGSTTRSTKTTALAAAAEARRQQRRLAARELLLMASAAAAAVGGTPLVAIGGQQCRARDSPSCSRVGPAAAPCLSHTECVLGPAGDQ